jgi:hypothetical protein
MVDRKKEDSGLNDNRIPRIKSAFNFVNAVWFVTVVCKYLNSATFSKDLSTYCNSIVHSVDEVYTYG